VEPVHLGKTRYGLRAGSPAEARDIPQEINTFRGGGRKMALKPGIFTLLCTAVLCAQAEVSEYPYVSTIPSSPTAGDTVLVSVILGLNNNSCIPTFTDLDYELIPSAIMVFPPAVTMNVSYQAHPPQGTECSPAFTAYGPKYTLPKASAGSYTVKRGDSILGTFSVSANPDKNPYTLSGEVFDDPFPLERLPLPIAGAKVYVQYLADYLAYDNENMGGAAIYPDFILDSAITDNEGAFSIDGLSYGTYEIIAQADGFRSRSVNVGLSGDTSITILLLSDNAVATVTGIVSYLDCPGSDMQAPCRSLPIPQCTVQVALNGCASFGTEPMMDRLAPCETFTAVTDENGGYRIEDIPLSTNNLPVTITAKKEGFVTGRDSVELSNGQTVEVDFLLDRAYTNSHSQEENGIVFKIATEKSVYAVGERVRVRYSVHNTTDQNVSFGPHSSTCAYELTLDSEENGVQDISGNTICTDDLVYTNVEPGDSVVNNFSQYHINEVLSSVALTAWIANAENTRVSVGIDIEPSISTEWRSLAAGESGQSRVVATPGGAALRISLSRSQTIRITGYRLNGRRFSIPALSRHLPKGMHHLKLPKTADGVSVLRIETEDFTETLRIPSAGNGR